MHTVQIPEFDYYFSADRKKVFYRYTNCVEGFDLPLFLTNGKANIRIVPNEKWQGVLLKNEGQAALFHAKDINFMYYVTVKEGK